MKDKKAARGERAEGQDLRRRVADLEADCERLELANKALQASEANWRSLTENAPDIVITADREGTILFVNHTIPGLTPEEVVGTSVYDYVSPEHHDTLKTSFERVFRTGEGATYELAGAGPHGATAWYRSCVGPIKRDGKVVGVTVITRGITEDKEAEQALEQSEALLRAVLSSAQGTIIGVFDRECKQLFVGMPPELERRFGFTAEQAVGKSLRDLLPAPDAEKRIAAIEGVFRTGTPVRFEGPADAPSGPVWEEALLSPVKDASGQISAVVAFVRDITEQRRAHEQLAEQRQLLNNILRHIPHGVFWKDRHSVYLGCNDNFAKAARLNSPEDVVGKTDADLAGRAEHAAKYARDDRQVVETEKPILGREETLRAPDGTARTVLASKVPLRDAAGEVMGILGIFTDITERKAAVQALRRSKQRFQDIIDNTWDIVFEVDPEGNYTFLNKAGERVTGYPMEILLTMNMRDLVAPEYLVEVFRRMARRIRGDPLPQPFDFDMLHRDGHRVRLELTTTGVEKEGKLVAVQGIARDVTQRVRAEEELRRSEEAGRRFRAQLTALHEVTIELSMTDSLDDLCRHAVELGRSKLGFDRLGLWFTTDEPRVLAGSFGIDEHGNLRDERGSRVNIAGDRLADEIISKKTVVAVVEDAVIYDFEERPVGKATRVVGALWDGDDVLGYLSTDNLISREEITPNQRELLRLYASALGHLCSRKRAEDGLRRSEEAERNFRSRLTALHEVTVELSAAGSFDELCRRAVELGRSRLGFDRLGTWFLEEPPNTVRGGFGTDEHGRISDERAVTGPVAEGTLMWQAITEELPFGLIEDTELLKAEGKVVGRGTLAMASLWDGERVIGCICMDNLLQGKPVTRADGELLRLYASLLGHLCSRQKAEEELRRSEEAERNFGSRLTALHEMTVELSMAESFDELCRRAVELGRSRLGFDRLGTWFLDESPNTVRGGFGTDEHGQISDDRSEVWPVAEGTLMWRVITEEVPFGLIEDSELLDAEGKVVGRRTLAMASLWDGERVIGCICMDNRLQGKPVTRADCELLRLYASLLGHLCSRQQAEEELLVRNSAIHSAINAIALGDLDGCLTYVNPSFLRLWGYDSEDEVLGRPSVSFWRAPEEAAKVVEVLRAEGNWTGELTALRKDGTTFDVEVSTSMVADEAGQPICRMGSFLDISERKRAERAMRTAQRKLMTAREEERRRLASELHDSVGQGLIAMQLTLGAALAGRSENSIAEGAERTRAQCDALVQEVRAIGRGLYPATLESIGLEAALRQLGRDFEPQTEVVVHWSKHCQPGSMREDVDIALFRIGQEAVANAVRHGKAERVELSLACPEGYAVFTVTDNGSGFDPGAAMGKGLGLTTMQERAEAIGGKFDIHSRPGQTIVRVRVPAELARNPDYKE